MADTDAKKAAKLAQYREKRDAAHKDGNKGLAAHFDKRHEQLKKGN